MAPMKTRRKSKAAAAAAAEADPQEPASPDVASSQQTEDIAGPSKADLVLSIPDDIDIEFLASLLPETSLTTPNADAIFAFYRLIVTQASELDATQRETEELRSEVEKKEIELDQSLQDRESAVQEVELQLGEVREELKHVKHERDELLASRNTLQGQISTLSTSQSTSSTELDTLRHRVDDTEREKRELLGVVSRLKEDSAQRDEEVTTLRDSLKQARQEHQSLEAQVRELRSAESSTKFKLESLTQQLDLSKEEASRVSSELTTKSEEFANYRRSKHAELSQLQSAHDALVQTHASTEGTLRALQSSHTTQSQQLSHALGRIQDLTSRLAEQDATYASEAAGLKRLVEMMEEREAQAKSIVESIEKDYANVGAKAEKREAELLEQVERQRRIAEDAETRIEELERVLEKVNRGEFPIQGPGATPGTPARSATPDLMTQGMMGLSPTVAMVNRAQKSGKTFTEVYADYVRLQDEYAKKSAEYDRMDRTLGQVLAQIEERAPVLAQQRAEYERLQSEAAQLASQLAEALADRDSSSAAAHDTAQKLVKTARENDLLQKQLNDLGRQIQLLLKELGRRQDPSIPSDEDLEEDPSTLPAENIDDVITNNLVLFRSIPALQERNQKLLGIVRDMGAKMEAEERDYREALDKEQAKAIREAHDAIQELEAQLESQKKSSEVKIQAYIKERDSLKVMLSRATPGRPEEQPSGLNGHVNGVSPVTDSQLAKELSEIQGQFDAYKAEMGIDSERLRDDYVHSQREVAQLNAMVAKANAKLELMTDRHKIAQEQYAIQAREIDNLTKRNQQLYDQYTRVDIECNRVTEDFVAANGRLEQLRNECANLRAEKKIWESVQSRLVDENKALSIERSHLSDLMSNVQKMHNDLERSGENDRRRLESQIQMLEHQSQDLRDQLGRERETVRRVTLQREVEAKELRTAVDTQAQELAKTRESLIGAETSKKHFEERVQELTRRLQGDEEKLAVYERRSSAINGVAHGDNAPDLTREQQLEAEVAELRSSLKVAQLDLANARSNVQQFQEISQANEEALATLSATYDEYKASTEAQITNSEAERDVLQKRLDSLTQELQKSQEALAESQRILDTERDAWENDKKTLEDTIVDLTTAEKNVADDRTSRDAEVHAQEERVKAAEERYSREVVAHAESIKAIEELKKRLAVLQASARENLTNAETAQAKLSASEASWGQQRQALDREIADLAARCKALTEQNNVLHQHLDSVSSQAARIREAANATPGSSSDVDPSEDSDTKLSELRAVITYLRKEKEIVDMQYELSKQENARLKAQIGHLTHDLEETRATLSEERERAVSSAATDAQHAELVEKIQQLNLLRESNATLRADSEAHAKRARDLDIQVKLLTVELEPLRERERILQADLDAQKGHVSRLEDESRKWQQRNSQLLSKYDRIDPAEVQALRNEIEALKAEKVAWETSTSTNSDESSAQQAKIAELEKTLQDTKAAHQRQMGQFKQRIGEMNGQQSRLTSSFNESQAQLKAVMAERDALKASGSGSGSDPSKQLADELEKLRAEKTRLEHALENEKKKPVPVSTNPDQEAKISQLTAERDQLLAEKASWAKAPAPAGADAQQTKSEWEAEKAELLRSRDEAVAQAKAAKEEADKAKEAARGLRMANDKFTAKIADLQKFRHRAAEEQEAAIKTAVEKATGELQNSATQPTVPAPSEELLKKHAEELRALEARLKAEHEAALQAAVAAAAAAAASPSTSTHDQNAAIDAAVAAKEAELQAMHQEAIAKAMESGRLEGAFKLKVKDGQMVKTQRRLKELEAQIEEWKKAGVVPATWTLADAAALTASPNTSAPPSTAAPPTTTASLATAAPLATTAPPAQHKTETTARGGAPGLPRRPTLNAPVASGSAPAPTAATERGRGRGRGVARGMSIRGAAAPGVGRGGNVSIMGAAAKRAREENDGGAEGALVKRLKPADGAEGEGASVSAPAPTPAPRGGKPVQLQRNRVGPS